MPMCQTQWQQGRHHWCLRAPNYPSEYQLELHLQHTTWMPIGVESLKYHNPGYFCCTSDVLKPDQSRCAQCCKTWQLSCTQVDFMHPKCDDVWNPPKFFNRVKHNNVSMAHIDIFLKLYQVRVMHHTGSHKRGSTPIQPGKELHGEMRKCPYVTQVVTKLVERMNKWFTVTALES
jgi:hypothetical protein